MAHAGPLVSQAPPKQARHATYDFTEGPTDPDLGLQEVWVDTKSPGDGFTYSVGTIEVVATSLAVAPTFSQVPIEVAAGLTGFAMPASTVAKKQVVVVQAVNCTTQQIVWQKFYYGDIEDSASFANARGISVWPAENPMETRVAICGETTHNSHPLDQGPPSLIANTSKGFVAVFDGNGLHLWSHLFFGQSGQGGSAGDVAVTDLSVRVEDGVDVVTYCGFSDIGNGTLTPQSMQPVLPFTAPPAPVACPSEVPAGGAVDTGGSWDGFVGRIAFDAGGNPQRTIVFHSIVGGGVTDGLFGIAEATPDRFLVVGSTGFVQGDPGAGGTVFPFTDAACVGAASGDYRQGVVMQFDASGTSGGGPLVLDWSERIGSGGAVDPATFTSARDVVVQRGWGANADLVVVVGQTNDAGLFQPFSNAFLEPSSTFGGGYDGYVLATRSQTAATTWDVVFGAFRGREGDDGLTGVQSWNEFNDHFSVVGYFDDEFGANEMHDAVVAADIEVSSYWFPGGLGFETRRVALGGTQMNPIGATDSYQPTALGVANAGFEYLQGGGITVDETGRVTVVGARVQGLGTYDETSAELSIVPGRATNYPNEAYRAVLDMLPDLVGRTDGTGVPVPFGGPQYPLPTDFGGTTPECALVPFGRRAGEAPAIAPSLDRMLIDYFLAGDPIGRPGAGDEISVVVDRPPSTPAIVHAWQIDFPGAPGMPAAPLNVDGCLIWMADPLATVTVVPATFGGSTYQAWVLPPGGGTVTVQLVSLLINPVSGGSVGPTCAPGVTTTWAASPALWLSY